MTRMRVCVRWYAMASLVAATLSAYGGITEGLVAHYPFDGNAKDVSGHGNDGTVHGAILATDRFARVNAAYWFDGSGDYLEMPHSPQVNANTNDISVSLWLRYGAQPAPAYYAAIFIKAVNLDYPYEGITLFVDSPNDGCTFRLHADEPLSSQTNGLHNNGWRHFVCLKQGNEIKLYIDGVLDNSRVITHTAVDNAGAIILGANHVDHNNQNYQGSMDDLRIYNRALTPSDITALYHLQPGALVITSTPTSVSYQTSVCTIAGANDICIGWLWASNAANAQVYSFPAAPEWTSSDIALDVGLNTIIVSGTDAFSMLAITSTNVTRKAATPTGVAASDGTFTNKVVLAWLAAPGAESYRVLRAETNDSAVAGTLATAVSNTVYDDTTAVPGLLYYYWLIAQQNGVEGDPSVPDSGYRQLQPSAGIAATLGYYTNTVDVSWAAVEGATKYRVYRADSPLTNLASVIASDITDTNCTDATVTPGLVYYYWVQAQSAVAASGWSGTTPGYALLAANFADKKTWSMRDTKKYDTLTCKQLPGPWSELLAAGWSIGIANALTHEIVSGPFELVTKNGKLYTYKSATAVITYTQRYNKRKDTYKVKLVYKFLGGIPTKPGIHLGKPANMR